jgi:methylglutaconyl-CoA hydratase
MSEQLIIATDAGGVATVTLNRAARHNAFDDRFIAELAQAFTELATRTELRAVVLRAGGKNFCAGADIEWMRRMAGYSHAENVEDARGLAGLFRAVYGMPVPVIARVQGAAMGGGAGLVACCDMVVASKDATFAFSEVRLGIIPATISPYVLRAIGERAARRYLLTGERFGAERAFELGLVHEVVEAAALDEAVETLVDGVLKSGPAAVRAARQLIRDVEGKALTPDLIEMTCHRIADARASAEGREGLAAFLEKRRPNWVKE